jgi:hypothetical protein
MGIGGNGELDSAMSVLEVAKRYIPQVRATIAWVAEAVGALRVLGIDVGEEPTAVPVGSEEFDDGIGIEIESGASRDAGGAAFDSYRGVAGDSIRVLSDTHQRDTLAAIDD